MHGLLLRFRMRWESRDSGRIWSNICIHEWKSQAMQISAGETGFCLLGMQVSPIDYANRRGWFMAIF